MSHHFGEGLLLVSVDLARFRPESQHLDSYRAIFFLNDANDLQPQSSSAATFCQQRRASCLVFRSRKTVRD